MSDGSRPRPLRSPRDARAPRGPRPTRSSRSPRQPRLAALSTPTPGGPDEGRAAGRARRADAPRTAHAAWDGRRRNVDPIATIAATNRSRVPELVPVRWERMAASPFAFYRGAPALMARDLATTPTSGIHVQACGDAHLANFGLFGTPERQLVFDVNDFDETLPAPWEWDVKRLAASFVVAARTVGIDEPSGCAAAVESVRSYRTEMLRLAEVSVLDVWYEAVRADDILSRLTGPSRRQVEKTMTKSRANTAGRALGKLTEVVDGEHRFLENPPTTTRFTDPAVARRARTLVERYLETLSEERRVLFDQYRFVDGVQKVVGVGSVGTRCSVALFVGKVHGDPLFLQVKEATASVLEPHVGRSQARQHGERVVVGQRITQAASDLFLGWTSVDRRHYYVRQLRDMKGGADLTAMTASGLAAYATLCGVTLARAHARTGVAAEIAGYLGPGDRYDRAVGSFARSYADQNDRDHEALVAAVAAGRIPVAPPNT